MRERPAAAAAELSRACVLRALRVFFSAVFFFAKQMSASQRQWPQQRQPTSGSSRRRGCDFKRGISTKQQHQQWQHWQLAASQQQLQQQQRQRQRRSSGSSSGSSSYCVGRRWQVRAACSMQHDAAVAWAASQQPRFADAAFFGLAKEREI